jgi:hypothetical protein
MIVKYRIKFSKILDTLVLQRKTNKSLFWRRLTSDNDTEFLLRWINMDLRKLQLRLRSKKPFFEKTYDLSGVINDTNK